MWLVCVPLTQGRGIEKFIPHWQNQAYMFPTRSGIAKPVIIVILLVLVGVSFVLMTREQEAREASVAARDALVSFIDSEEPTTADQVHEKLARQPHVARNPGKHRLVEEYKWSGPMSTHTVYAYYSTGATQLLEAVALNQKLEDWEGDDR